MNHNVLFLGDIVPTEHSAAQFAAGELDVLFEDMLPVLQDAEQVIANLECALTEKDCAIRKHGPNLKGPLETAQTLKAAHVTACSLANNHVFDFGTPGLRDTFAALDGAGIARFGAGENEEEACRPLYFTSNGKRIAVLSVVEHEYSYAIENRPGSAPFDPFDTLPRIAEVKKAADYLVIMYHGGKEQSEYPSPRLRKACQSFVKMGADLVLCQHSHIIGTEERIGDAVILYGQGNFHFVSFEDRRNMLKGWTTGLAVSVQFGDTMQVEYIPVESTRHGLRRTDAEKTQQILAGLAERSQTLLDGTWLDGWNAFVEGKRSDYIAAVEGVGRDEDHTAAVELFAHYLQCEAHFDVWRTLYPNWHEAGVDELPAENA